MSIARELLAFATRIYYSIFHAFVVWTFSFFIGIKLHATLTLIQYAKSTSTAINPAFTNKVCTKFQSATPQMHKWTFQFKRTSPHQQSERLLAA